MLRTGWVVWREGRDLSEHVAISVTYLGGKADSYTRNFSRPASGVYVQFYRLLRFGLAGYRQVEESMMRNASFPWDGLRAMEHEGEPLFHDAKADQSMFRIVVKGNLTRDMAEDLLESFEVAITFLDSVDFSGLHGVSTRDMRHKDQRIVSNHC